MHFSLLKFVIIAFASAVSAVLGMLRHAIRTGEDPSDDGPRALISEFLGLLLGFFFLIWSFTVDGKPLQWKLRSVAAVAAIVGVLLSAHFAGTTEVPENADKEPTGFKSNVAEIHLE